MDFDEPEPGDTVYYKEKECEVNRGYNGINCSVTEVETDETILVDPRYLTAADEFEPSGDDDVEIDPREMSVRELKEATSGVEDVDALVAALDLEANREDREPRSTALSALEARINNATE